MAAVYLCHSRLVTGVFEAMMYFWGSGSPELLVAVLKAEHWDIMLESAVGSELAALAAAPRLKTLSIVQTVRNRCLERPYSRVRR